MQTVVLGRRGDVDTVYTTFIIPDEEYTSLLAYLTEAYGIYESLITPNDQLRRHAELCDETSVIL